MIVKHFWSFLFFLVPFFGVAAFVAAPHFNIWLPRDISEQGRTIDNLFMFILYLTGVVFIVTERVLYYFLWKYDGKSNKEPIKFSHGSHALELVWTIIPAVTLLVHCYLPDAGLGRRQIRRYRRSPSLVK